MVDVQHCLHPSFQALVCVTPLLGLGYLLTLIPPHRQNSFFNVFQIGRSLLLSSQVSLSPPDIFNFQNILDYSEFYKWKSISTINISWIKSKVCMFLLCRFLGHFIEK